MPGSTDESAWYDRCECLVRPMWRVAWRNPAAEADRPGIALASSARRVWRCHLIRRTFLLLSLFLLPLTAAAQMNDLGVFISTSQLEDNEIDDAGDVFDLEFDEDMGVGI